MAEKNNTQMPDVNEQIKNRMDKLKTLQEEGRDPFEITKYDVTIHPKDIKEHFASHIYIYRSMDHNSLFFVDERLQTAVFGK